jgi:argininosuccinate lyase
VNYAVKKGKSLRDLTLKEYQKFSAVFDNDIFDITVETSAAAREVTGGTGYKQVAKQIAAAKRRLKESMSDE